MVFHQWKPDQIKSGNLYPIIDAHHDLKYNSCEGKSCILIGCGQVCQ